MRQLVFTGAALVGVASFAGVTMQKAFPVDFSESGQDVVKSLVVMAFFVGLPLLGIAITLLTSLLVAKPDGWVRQSLEFLAHSCSGFFRSFSSFLALWSVC